MKLNAAVNRMAGARNNVQNGISFVEIQDGMLETVGRIVGRMAELKGMATQDPLKSSQDVESYNNEFRDLQKQLRDINKSTFNGVSLFADFAGTKETVTTDKTKFKGDDTRDNVIEIFTSSEGSSGTKVSLYRSALLSALTIANTATSIGQAQFSSAGAGTNSAGTTTFGLFAADDGIDHLTQCIRIIHGCVRAGGCQYCVPACTDRWRNVQAQLRSRIIGLHGDQYACSDRSCRRCRYRSGECKPRQILNPNPGIRRYGRSGELNQRCGTDATQVTGDITHMQTEVSHSL